MCTEGPKSVLTLIEIRDDPAADRKDRLKAATELMNRAGPGVVSESHLVVDHNYQMTEAQKDARILALAAELGMPEEYARKMLVAPADFEKNSKGVFELPKP